jgi:hypothetical protein
MTKAKRIKAHHEGWAFLLSPRQDLPHSLRRDKLLILAGIISNKTIQIKKVILLKNHLLSPRQDSNLRPID